ncbi:hypothetical protein TNCV_5109401 [Trichonephila clavipes]|nr:hypothetical protein TNCV_5109401 [Trichonephila clavipes]
MAEGGIYPVKEHYSYFCCHCARLQNKEIELTYVVSLEMWYNCTACGARFQTGYAGAEKKRKSAHTNVYPCEVCGEIFQKKFRLLYHSYKHSDEWPHRCSFCNRGFAIISDQEYHLKQRAKIREISCRKCLKHFQGKYCPGALTSLEGRIYCENCSTESSPIEYVTS